MTNLPWITKKCRYRAPAFTTEAGYGCPRTILLSAHLASCPKSYRSQNKIRMPERWKPRNALNHSGSSTGDYHLHGVLEPWYYIYQTAKIVLHALCSREFREEYGLPQSLCNDRKLAFYICTVHEAAIGRALIVGALPSPFL